MTVSMTYEEIESQKARVLLDLHKAEVLLAQSRERHAVIVTAMSEAAAHAQRAISSGVSAAELRDRMAAYRDAVNVDALADSLASVREAESTLRDVEKRKQLFDWST